MGLGSASTDNLRSDKGFLAKYMITPENAEKISETLCRVRGAPLKLG